MKRIAFVIGFVLFPIAVLAADAPPPAATTPVTMSMLDIQVATISIQNAGAACDAGVRAYCQIVPAREATIKKLMDAAQSLQKPAGK